MIEREPIMTTTPPRPPRSVLPLTLEVEHGLVTRFRVEAARRDMPVRRLLHDLLDRIVEDQLTSAILDDRDPVGA
jgi:hypothetical protein